MSWPGEKDPPTGAGGGGRGRRRRTDSPPEDPHQAAQNPSGSGRRGSGEYERPAEYVARAEQEAAAYDQYSGYADPAYYQPGAYQQPQDPYQPQEYYQQDAYAYEQPQSPYQEQQPTGYAEYENLNSSGYYQPTVPPQAPYQPQPAYQPQPSYEEAAYEEPIYEQPAYQQQTSYQFPPIPMPEPVAKPAPAPAPVPEPEPEPTAPDPDADLSNWLHFVESDADRKAERARRRRVRLIALAVALVLLVVGGGVWFLLSGDSGAKATQTTVLLQVKDKDGNAVGNVVLVAAKTEVAGQADPHARGAALLIPSELTVESTALDSQPFGGAMPATSPAGKDALSSLIGVDVDGVWSMDALTFASLLNNLIGVTVDVDPASAAAVLGPDGKPLFKAGKQDLTGDKAAYYATYRGKDEPPAGRLARFGQVVAGMLAKIPHQASTTAAVLDSLAAVPDPALPNDRLAAILTALGGEEQAQRFDQQPLPLRGDGSGVMDLDKASAVVKQLLGGASKAKDNGGLTRVSLADGTGRADTVTSRAMADSKLLGNGYSPVDQGVVAPAPTTSVLVPNQDAMSLGKQIAAAMGLPEDAVRVSPFDTTLIDARVVLGADWTQLGQVPADQVPTPSPSDAVPTGGDASGSASAPPPDGSKSGTGKATTSHRTTATSGHSSH